MARKKRAGSDGTASLNEYQRIIAHVFEKKHRVGETKVEYTLADERAAAKELGLEIDNFPDLNYSFRSGRDELPESIKKRAPKGHVWIISGAGKGKYRAMAHPAGEAHVTADPSIIPIKVPDSTPGIIALYAKKDEQALLAQIRYNRLLDIYTGIACYSLQNHYRTSLQGWGQVEVDELYVGLDKNGVHYLFPVEAKSIGQKLGKVQVEQNFMVGLTKFPTLLCRPIGAQQLAENVICLYELISQDGKIGKRREVHFLLVPPDQVTQEDLRKYREAMSE